MFENVVMEITWNLISKGITLLDLVQREKHVTPMTYQKMLTFKLWR